MTRSLPLMVTYLMAFCMGNVTQEGRGINVDSIDRRGHDLWRQPVSEKALFYTGSHGTVEKK